MAQNKKARMLYELSHTFEAGIVLHGQEVKSIRSGKAHFVDSYVDIVESEAFILGLHIAPYEHRGYIELSPTRKRKLLLHRREIRTIEKNITLKGITVVPLVLYLKEGLVKIEIALGKGKKLHDHRATLKERAVQKDIERAMASYK